MQQEISKAKQDAIKYLSKYLDELEKGDDRDHKRISLLSYWMKDYTGYLSREKDFQPHKLPRYKRGDIIKVNLGYNVGSEEGGLHYAVVVDMKNDLNSPVITIIPLTSIKDIEKKINYKDVLLGDEIYQKLKLKGDVVADKIDTHINKLKVDIEILVQRNLKTKELLKTIENIEDVKEREEIKENAGKLLHINQIDIERVEKEIAIYEKDKKDLMKIRKYRFSQSDYNY